MSTRKPTRDLDALHITHNPPGAEKEKVKERAAGVPLSGEFDHIPFVHEQWGGTYRDQPEEERPKRKEKSRKRGRPYAELRAASSFSFLDGASLPEEEQGSSEEAVEVEEARGAEVRPEVEPLAQREQQKLVGDGGVGSDRWTGRVGRDDGSGGVHGATVPPAPHDGNPDLPRISTKVCGQSDE